jgi:hypothetical protein
MFERYTAIRMPAILLYWRRSRASFPPPMSK